MIASATERARAVSPLDPALTSETRRSLRAIAAPQSWAVARAVTSRVGTNSRDSPVYRESRPTAPASPARHPVALERC